MQSKKRILDELNRKYSDPYYETTDPVEFISHYKNPLDQEIVAFICAVFAYGNAVAIRNFLNKLLDLLGDSPHETLYNRTFRIDPAYRYRFQSSRDIASFLSTISNILHKQRTSFPLFEDVIYNELMVAKEMKHKAPLIRGVWEFERWFCGNSNLSSWTRGLTFLTGSGKERNSPLKRMMLFLRWMTRKTPPDLGLYKKIQPADLIIPLDTHMARMGRILGFTQRKSNDLQTALEITNGFRNLVSDDPLCYDFSLTRPGIIGNCRTNTFDDCAKSCPLNLLCSEGVEQSLS